MIATRKPSRTAALRLLMVLFGFTFEEEYLDNLKILVDEHQALRARPREGE